MVEIQMRGFRRSSLTVDGNGHGLSQDVAIGADEDGDLGQLVVLEEVGSRVGGVDNDGLELKAIGLCNRKDTRGAGVALSTRSFQLASVAWEKLRRTCGRAQLSIDLPPW
jgi:hypothetical protein